MASSSVRVLVVDDNRAFRRWVCSTLEKRPELRIVGEASDGLEAVQKAEELKPDLILLDIGLPTLNGVEAGRQIRKLSPKSKILYLSQESSAYVAQETLRLGATGYVVKGDAGTELLAAVEAVCHGRRFLSSGLMGYIPTEATDTHVSRRHHGQETAAPVAATKGKNLRNHEVQFYTNDAAFVVGLASFIEGALEAGSAAIVVATESHRKRIVQRLQAQGVDVAAAIKQGRYFAFDAAEALSTFMESAGPSRERFQATFGPVVRKAEAASRSMEKKVVLFGEMVALLCAEGKTQAAIELERIGKEMAQAPFLHLRCGYPMTVEITEEAYAAICAEHSVVLPAEM